MDRRTVSTIKILVLGSLIGSLLFFAGCKGDTGAAGPPGAPASFGNAACTDCHHLNNTPVTPSSLFFADGLAGPDKTISAGTSTTLAAVVSKLPAGETASSYRWMPVSGLTTTTSSALASTITVTMVSQPTGSYKQALVDQVPSAGLITDDTGSVIRDATLVVPLTNDAVELATAAQFQLTVFTTSGKSYYDLVNVFNNDAKTYLSGVAAVNTGLQTVPIGVPVLLKATTAGSYDWAISGPTTTLIDPTEQIASFTPVTAGTYTVTVNGVTIPLFAGTWRGVAVGTDAQNNPQPDPVCTGCHNNTIATDNFTPWRVTGHAHIFSKNLNNGGHYGPDCFQCHTVGFNTSPLAVNNGFDDQPNYSTFKSDTSFFSSSADQSRYQRMWSSPSYSALAKETNVQCEQCHGPQNSTIGTSVGNFIGSHGTTTNSSIGSARTSMAADVCGFCHGEPLRHSRFQQWQESGHGQYDLAIGEAVSSTTETGSVLSTNCAGCHSAQGFLIYLDRLNQGIPLRTLPAFTIPPDSVQPVTCQVCHDPHAEGASSGVPNTATVRVSENTPKLPGGFLATGVGRGAMCIVCHNSRNGGVGNDSFLHQDGDPKFGTLTSYAAPHIANQGDVLMGHNAYFVGGGDLRSPHSMIPDTCANCHMERTPPPPLLSYNLSGTNHTFRASIDICAVCHGVNQSLAFMRQTKVKQELDELQTTIVDLIISRNTGTPLDPATTLTTSHGSPAINAVYSGGTTTVINVANVPGLCISGPDCLGTDILAKALWNYFLIQNDQSFGIHNPDFTDLVLSESNNQVKSIREQ